MNPHPNLHLLRTLRTPSSERFLVQIDGSDAAAVDVHFLPDTSVDATVLVIEGGPISEAEVPDLLQMLDERLFPQVSLDDRKLSFSVVIGRPLGAFTPVSDDAQ